MESKLEGTVNYLRFIDCTKDAAKQNEELHDRLPKQHWYIGRPTYIPIV